MLKRQKANPRTVEGQGFALSHVSGAFAAHNTLFLEGVDVDLLVYRGVRPVL